MKDKTKESKDIAPSATEDCADVTSRYERYKKEQSFERKEAGLNT